MFRRFINWLRRNRIPKHGMVRQLMIPSTAHSRPQWTGSSELTSEHDYIFDQREAHVYAMDRNGTYTITGTVPMLTTFYDDDEQPQHAKGK